MSFIEKIKLEQPSSYCRPIITFDIDWAHDDIIFDLHHLVASFKIETTWMVTHKSDYLYDLRKSSNCELGIHPNFNYLLSGDLRLGKSAEEVVERMMVLVPSCKVVRSHSVCQSSRISQIFWNAGIKFESNDYMPASLIAVVEPWELEIGIIKVPYFFSDELACMRSTPSISELYCRAGLKIFDFHPIHVFLNTESLDRYERTRPLHQNPKELIKHRFEGYGTRSRLIELLELSAKPIESPL
jgi:hypothetical protein